MTYSFGTFPGDYRMSFVRATLDEVKQMMTDYPREWHSYPSSTVTSRNSVYQLIHEGRTHPRDWSALLLPQNYDARMLFIDVDHPEWIAIIHAYPLIHNIAYGPYWYRYHHLGIQESTGPLGIEEIDILYRVRTPHPEYDDYFNGTYLSLKVNSTEPNDPKLVGDQSYIEGAVWSYYEINAKGLCGFEGLDAPLISTLTEEEREQFPVKLGKSRSNNVSYESQGSRSILMFRSEDEVVEAFHPYLPFDIRGCKRAPDCVNLPLIESWLKDTFGIRWNDPSFYDRDSLLYHLSEPGGFKDFFTPRIPIEKFNEMRGIDHDYIRDLVARGKL